MRPAAVETGMDAKLSGIESVTLTERMVLLAITDAEVCEETPVASVDIGPRCRDLCEDVGTELVSSPGEPEIMRSLSVLGAEPYVEEVLQEASPVGKGRPQYRLSVGIDAVLDALAEDERLEEAVAAVRDSGNGN